MYAKGLFLTVVLSQAWFQNQITVGASEISEGAQKYVFKFINIVFTLLKIVPTDMVLANRNCIM